MAAGVCYRDRTICFRDAIYRVCHYANVLRPHFHNIIV